MSERQTSKVKFKMTITVYDDNKVQVESPPDFLLSSHILNLAQRALIDLMAQKRQHEEQRRIVQPSFAASVAFAGAK